MCTVPKKLIRNSVYFYKICCHEIIWISSDPSVLSLLQNKSPSHNISKNCIIDFTIIAVLHNDSSELRGITNTSKFATFWIQKPIHLPSFIYALRIFFSDHDAHLNNTCPLQAAKFWLFDWKVFSLLCCKISRGGKSRLRKYTIQKDCWVKSIFVEPCKKACCLHIFREAITQKQYKFIAIYIKYIFFPKENPGFNFTNFPGLYLVWSWDFSAI